MLFSWNWSNCWRLTFIMLFVAALFGMVGLIETAHILGLIGGVCFVVMSVIRFEDVLKFIAFMKKLSDE